MEQMLGSYPPHPEEVRIKDFEPEESPSGLLARSGSYNVRSRVVDDDNHIVAGKIPRHTILRYLCHSLMHFLCRLGVDVQARKGMGVI